jgi:hypothetical protein
MGYHGRGYHAASKTEECHTHNDAREQRTRVTERAHNTDALSAKRLYNIFGAATSTHRLFLAGIHGPAGKLQVTRGIFQVAA